MIKKINLTFIILVPATLTLIFYLTTTTRTVTLVNDGAGDEDNSPPLITEKNRIDPEKLESGYKAQTKLILDSYTAMGNSIEISSAAPVGRALNTITELKKKLTELSVPEKYKDLHLGLVLAFSNLELYLKDGDENKNRESINSIKEIKDGYSWLNN